MDNELFSPLEDVPANVEEQGVIGLLGGLSRKMDQVRYLLPRLNQKWRTKNQLLLLAQIRQAPAALHLAGVYHNRECIPFLRDWEDIDRPLFLTKSFAMDSEGWWLEPQHLRLIVHHSLKRLGEEPRGFPTYNFIKPVDNARQRFLMPECLKDRRERTAQVSDEMSAEAILQLLGSPDFIKDYVQDAAAANGRSKEAWDYDLRGTDGWGTLRITWEEKEHREQITGIQQIAPSWLDTEERVSTLWI